jgi:tight adherence protein B
VVNVAERAMKADFESRLNLRLTRAGLAMTPAEWLLTHVGITILAGFVGMVLGGPALMVLLLLLGAVLPWLFLSRKRSKRQGAFNSQLAETLTLVSGGLRAGLSLPQAVDSVVREGVEPMAGELRRALGEQRLGIPIEDALESVGVRMESQDFAWVVMAIRIQREVGGNLSELLTTVAATIRERDYLRRQVKVLSAEGRMSAWVLGALPILLFAYMMFVRPDYASIFFSTLPGLMMLAGAVVMLVLGFVVLFKVVKVEV